MTFALLGSRTSVPIEAYRRFMSEDPDSEEIKVAARLGRAPSTLSELLNRRAGNHDNLVADSRGEPKP